MVHKKIRNGEMSINDFIKVLSEHCTMTVSFTGVGPTDNCSRDIELV